MLVVAVVASWHIEALSARFTAAARRRPAKAEPLEAGDAYVEAADAELDKQLEQSRWWRDRKLTSHDYTAAVCARQ